MPISDVEEFAANSAAQAQLDHLKGPLQQGKRHPTQQESIFKAFVWQMGE
ncbi:MAG: hypothetical protein O3B65_04080 [Chloroflexi bacterium]|nr:hypothetical protein [Chloroflexota bacterium]